MQQHVQHPRRTRQHRIFFLASMRDTTRLHRLLRNESVGGLIMMVAAALGFVAANSPVAAAYFSLRSFEIGPEALHLRMPLDAWASDGLLAVFFFMVGLELKRELAEGALSRFSSAIIPVAAAVGGVIVPAFIYAGINFDAPGISGWAVPTATDIAFAVAVLALIAPGVPPALRMFLLTLAVVDDLIAVAIIATFYTDSLRLVPLLCSVIPLALYWWLAHARARWLAISSWGPWLLLLPLGVIFWAFIHLSGVHATIAGVILAFLVPVSGREGTALTEVFERRFRPLSSGFAVPIFAFFASGVAVNGGSRFPFDPIAVGVMAGLVIGKPLGIVTTTWLVTRFTGATLAAGITWRMIAGIGALAGVGFTVSLLVAELSFSNRADTDTARLAVLAASFLAVAAAFPLLHTAREKPRI